MLRCTDSNRQRSTTASTTSANNSNSNPRSSSRNRAGTPSGASRPNPARYPEAPVYRLSEEVVAGTALIDVHDALSPTTVEVVTLAFSPTEASAGGASRDDEVIFDSNGAVCVRSARHQCATTQPVTQVRRDATDVAGQPPTHTSNGYIVFSEAYLSAHPNSPIATAVRRHRQNAPSRDAAPTNAPPDTPSTITPPCPATEGPIRFRLKDGDHLYGRAEYAPCVGDDCIVYLR